MSIATEFRPRLQQLSQRLGLGRFFRWWLGELSDMVPLALSGASNIAPERRVLVQVSGLQVVFSRVSTGAMTEVGRLDMASLGAAGQQMAVQSELNRIVQRKDELALCLPPQQVLRKKLTLPLATEENLRQVLAFEMDRHTPFKAQQVYFDYRTERLDQQLEVSLIVAPREMVDLPLRQMTAWGAQVNAVLPVDCVTDAAAWNLLPAGQRQAGMTKPWSRIDMALAGGMAALLCIALALPIWQKRETVVALHPVVGKAYQQAEKAEALRRQLEALLAEYNYLLNKKRESPPVVAVLDDVTRVLPNDTWVQQFDLKGKEMQIQGETASSSKLVGLFEQSKTLHGANFRAPLTKGTSENSERFQLAAETRPLPRTETEPRILSQTMPDATPVVAEKDKLAKPPQPAGKGSAAETGAEVVKPPEAPAETKSIGKPIPPGSRL